MNVLEIDNKTYKFPAKWQEVTPKAFQKIAKYFLKALHKPQLNLVFLSAYIPRKVLRKIEAEKLQTIGEEALKFLSDYNFSADLLPRVRLGFTNYYSLGKNLERCTLNEYAHLDYYFWAYHTKKEASFLHKFCACLWRKGKDFLPQDIEKNEKLFSKMPEYLQLYSLLYFDSCKRNIVNQYKKVFEGGKSTNAGPDWNSVMLSICGQDISRIEIIENLPIHTALMYLLRLYKEEK
jgi:hypothetical protein